MRKLPPAARQWVISTTAILFILVGTLLLVAFAQGYSFDSKTKTIKANGLVLIDSSPAGANVLINSKLTTKKTPFRYTNAPEGEITVGLQKPEYREWQARQKVYPRQVTFLDYSILIPNILSQNPATQDKPYSSVYQSLDHSKTLAVSKDSLQLYNVTDFNQPKIIYQPSNAVTDPSKKVIKIEFGAISNDGSKAVIKQRLANNTTETVVVNTSGSSVDNLTQEFGFDFNNIWFNQRDTNELFWLDSTNLKKIKINSKSISSNLISEVLDASVEKDRLLIIKPSAENSMVALYSYDLSGLSEKQIKNLDYDAQGYEMSFVSSRYNENIVVKQNSNGATQLIVNPYGPDKTTKKLGDSIASFVVSPNQRFIVLNQDNKLRTLDLEFDQEYDYKTPLSGLTNWLWYDNFHLVLHQNNQIRIVDYDGQNNYLLTPTPDVVGFSINTNDKAVLPLNTDGNMFKLWLTKK